MECPASLYNRNSSHIDYLLMITQKYYDRSGLGYLLQTGAMDTTAVINEINDIISKEKRDKNK